MIARIRKEHEFYVGEVYGTIAYTYLGVKIGEHIGWKKVTPLCFTHFGAKWNLKKWKKDNFIERFDL